MGNPSAVGPRYGLFAAMALLCLALLSSVSAAAPPGNVVVVDFGVPVDPGSASLMSNAVAMARAEHAPAIVIEMNTPGGLLSDMTRIIASIQAANESGIPTYTYVPPNALAASAGSYIAMASNGILMGPGSEIGPSTPIVVGGSSLEQNHTEDAMIQLMVSLAQRWGRNETAAYAMVYSDTAYSASQAYEYHLIDGSATSLQGALAALGLPANYVTVHESTYERLLSALSDPTLDGMLILLGILAVTLDIYHPTLVLSMAGAIAIVAGLVGAEVIGASVLGILVMLIGAVLIVLELKLGHGLAMMGGVVVGAVGIYLLAQGIQYSPSPIGYATQIVLFGLAGVGVMAGLYVRWVIGPLKKRRHLTGPESLIGKPGKTTTALSPTGEVRVEGVVWRARSASGDMPEGRTVKVKAVEGLVLVVEEERPAAGTPNSP